MQQEIFSLFYAILCTTVGAGTNFVTFGAPYARARNTYVLLVLVLNGPEEISLGGTITSVSNAWKITSTFSGSCSMCPPLMLTSSTHLIVARNALCSSGYDTDFRFVEYTAYVYGICLPARAQCWRTPLIIINNNFAARVACILYYDSCTGAVRVVVTLNV